MLHKTLITTTLCLLAVATACAQIDIDVDLGKDKWYENPLVWVGGAVFLIILAFIARGGKKS